ncbi:hypothetical protein BX265_5021 [Streptomyces sp. TLI_235]|nr:hypothetical protein [Streptomyces sp. TLI_235]PBC80097.1 hypothetical protein BX265_4933 [Streptomyces sp. TLI_235]PBC80183.1 hypothetical protein BX265_5021 [Streptomyces sp. TLI_235]
MTSAPQPTEAAQRLASRYARFLELVDQCARAVAAGDWVVLADETGELSVTADEVSAAAEALTRDEQPTSGADILAAVKEQARPAD